LTAWKSELEKEIEGKGERSRRKKTGAGKRRLESGKRRGRHGSGEKYPEAVERRLEKG
jgi:hypothetical protein